MSEKNKKLKKHLAARSKADSNSLENPYNNSVLIGNWFEERFGDKNDKRAIAPGICGQSTCQDYKTLYKRDFVPPIDGESFHECQDYLYFQQMGFRNRLQGEMSNIKIWDSDHFEKNITTTKDIMHDILPRESAKRGEFNILVKVPRDDLMRSYGNSTKTGLRQWKACEKYREDNTPADMSNFKHAFKRIPLNPHRKVCKAPKKKTTITFDN